MKIFSDQVMQRAERSALRFAKRFRKNEDGATAIEFAFVALPFFALLFGIMELAIVFFINSALVHSTSEAGRHIRVGNFQKVPASRRSLSPIFRLYNREILRRQGPLPFRKRRMVYSMQTTQAMQSLLGPFCITAWLCRQL